MTWNRESGIVSNYVDHVFRNTETWNPSALQKSEPFYLGGSNLARPGECMNGKVFALRVSNKALSPSEMLLASCWPSHDPHILVNVSGDNPSGASFVLIDKDHRLQIRSGVALSADKVVCAGVTVAPGTYTGADGVQGAVKVDWIDGSGTLTVAASQALASAEWIAPSGGYWDDSANWLDGVLPSASMPANLTLSTLLPYAATVTNGVVAPPSLTIGNYADVSTILDIVPGGEMYFESKSLAIKDGGVLQVSGGTFGALNSTLAVERGGVVRVTDGTFNFTNNTRSTFILDAGARLELTGGDTVIHCGAEVFDRKAGSHIVASGNARLIMEKAPSVSTENVNLANLTFSDNAQFHTYAFYAKSTPLPGSGTITFKDHARWILNNNAAINIGFNNNDNSYLTVNLESDTATTNYNNILVGTRAHATLNIRGGHSLVNNSCLVAAGTQNGNMLNGTINVYDGSIVCRNNTQYTTFLYGIAVGDGKDVVNYAEVEGCLNVYPDGVVSNIPVNETTFGAGSYFRVGSGDYTKGTVNLMGGEIYHGSSLQCLIGSFGGVGVWNITSNGVAKIMSDTYIGGSYTNVLVGFNGSAKPDYTPFNGGEKFASAYDAFALSQGALNVEDGIYTSPSNIYLSVLGSGTINVGTNGIVEANNIVLSNSVEVVEGVPAKRNSTLCIRFDAEKAGCVKANGKFVVSEGSKLVLDFASYAKGEKTSFPIVQYAEREGFFADDDICIEGENVPGGGTLVKDMTRNGIHGLWYCIQRGTCILVK